MHGILNMQRGLCFFRVEFLMTGALLRISLHVKQKQQPICLLYLFLYFPVITLKWFERSPVCGPLA